MHKCVLFFTLIVFDQFAVANQKIDCVGSTPEFSFQLKIVQENKPDYGNAKFYATTIANGQIAHWNGIVLEYDHNYVSDGNFYEIVTGPELSAQQNLNLKNFQIINYQDPSLYRVESSAQFYWKLDGGYKCYPPINSLPGGCGPSFVIGRPNGGISTSKLDCHKK